MKLNLWRKRVGAPKAGEKPLPILFLVHGSSNSTRSSYDLHVPGKGEYSMMNIMARDGYDVWTMDHDGYGHSGSSGNNSDIASGVEDLKAAMPVVIKETGQQKTHMYGTSSGGIRAGAFAQVAAGARRPADSVRLHLQGQGAAEIARRRSAIDEFRANPRRKRDAAMIRSIFTRDGHPGPRSGGAGGDHRRGDEVRRHHSGRHLSRHGGQPADRRPEESSVAGADDPRRHDGNSTNEDLLDFYRQLPNGDRQFVILPDTAHSLGYSKNRHLLWYAVKNFLAAPAPVAASVGGFVHRMARRLLLAAGAACVLLAAGPIAPHAGRAGFLRRQDADDHLRLSAGRRRRCRRPADRPAPAIHPGQPGRDRPEHARARAGCSPPTISMPGPTATASIIGLPGRDWVLHPTLQLPGGQFDALKFNYVGSTGPSNNFGWVRADLGIASVAGWKASPRKVVFGALTPNTVTASMPKLMAAEGFPIQVVTGYRGTVADRAGDRARRGARHRHQSGDLRAAAGPGRQDVIRLFQTLPRGQGLGRCSKM